MPWFRQVRNRKMFFDAHGGSPRLPQSPVSTASLPSTRKRPRNFPLRMRAHGPKKYD